MNKFNAVLTLLLIAIVLYGFWPNFPFVVFKWLVEKDFFSQVIAVALGVFGGMWADNKLQEQETIKRIIGALEVIDAEIQSNIKAASNIKDIINSRPSYKYRSKYTLDQVINMTKDEEKWVADVSKQLVDKGYHSVLPIVSTLDNRKLFEKIVNTYMKLRNTQLVLGLVVMDSFNIDVKFSDQQKMEIIGLNDQQFNKLTEWLNALEENFKATDKDIVDEERKLLINIKKISFLD